MAQIIPKNPTWHAAHTSYYEAMTNQTRRQHIVSNFYLREFADERNQVWRVVLPGDKQHEVGTHNASVTKDFYTITLPDGTKSDFFEKYFSEIEADAASALREIVHENKWPIRGGSREALATWVALQHLRSEGVRNGQMQMQAQILKIIVGASGKEALRELIQEAEKRSVGDFELDQEWADITKPTGPDLIPDAKSHLRSLFNLWEPTAQQMIERTWTLFRFQRRSLITSDHPVSLAVGADYPQYMGVGLATTQGFVIPLSRRVGLIMREINQDSSLELALPGSTKMAKAFLRESIINARRFLYHHPTDTPLAGLILPEPQTQEISPAGDDWVIEEGLFGHLAKDKEAGSTLPRPPSNPFGSNAGWTIKDITWPIPHRRSNVQPQPEGKRQTD
ncbi:DUF4238 domain-containing protein [Nonomuraea sp. NPDC050556]|uniref:DUF4238 domain-containing protein n=1 Tax=Nonomuraea sp. NPDC050556 TaxID=3364369 RepID=UPI00378AA56B